MRYAKSDYPIGAKWQTENEFGTWGSIHLGERSEYGWEVWRWFVGYSDGSTPFPQNGWTTSRRTARELCVYMLYKMRFRNPRFKRVIESRPNLPDC